MMNTNTFSIWPLMWQAFNMGLLIALVVMGLRLLYLLWPRKKKTDDPAALSGVTLGEIIRQHRTRCHMTQEFVAEKLGVSRQAVSKWESNAADPSTANLLALAELFQADAAEMLRSIRAK